MRDYLDINLRKQIISEIAGSENQKRRERSFIRQEIYQGKLYDYLYEKMVKELGKKSAEKSRKISSINLTEKIVDEESKLYLREPLREFMDVSAGDADYISELYEKSRANIAFKKANKMFKLHDQAALKIVPGQDRYDIRALAPHHYDVIPNEQNPEIAEAYIISNVDVSLLVKGDGFNQKIADIDDKLVKARLYWWTDEYNFVTNGKGEFINENGTAVQSLSERELKNQAQTLNFIDIAKDKDFEFFVRSESLVTEFSLDLAMSLSDTAEVIRYQGFATGVVSSKERPENMEVGPRSLIWLKKDPNDDSGSQPTFQFVSPNPDIGSSLEFNNGLMSMFLTARGHSPKLVNAKGDSTSYTSGLDRFLATLEAYEGSQDDIDLFTDAEVQAFEIMKAWNHAYYNDSRNGFTSKIPEKAYLKIEYQKPTLELSESEELDVLEKKRKLGVINDVELIMEAKGLTKEEALDYLKENGKRIEKEIDEEIDATLEGEDTELSREIEAQA